MDLLRIYLKLILKKYKKDYLLVVLSIIAAYVCVVIIMVYIDNVLLLSASFQYPDFRYIYISIRTVFLIGGMLFIFNQYYNIMKAGLRDFYSLKKPDVTEQNIRVFMLIQILFLVFTTLPVGLLSAHWLTGMVLNLLGGAFLNSSMRERIDSVNTLLAITFITGCSIIFTGIYLERRTRKLPLSGILSDNSTNQ